MHVRARGLLPVRIAALGDIHGNIDALKAAYEAAVRESVKKIYHLGDLGGYAPFVNEVVDFLEEHKIEGVQGNYDEAVAKGKKHCGCRYEEPLQAEMAGLSFEWTKEHASRKSREYMLSLPSELSFHAEGQLVKLFHATPLKNNLYWHEEREEKFFIEMARRAAADVMIYGHTHRPYRKEIGGKVFINAGSVGKPKDGDTRACLAIIDILRDGVKADFLRVPYDLEKTAKAIRASGLPSYFAERLMEGR